MDPRVRRGRCFVCRSRQSPGVGPAQNRCDFSSLRARDAPLASMASRVGGQAQGVYDAALMNTCDVQTMVGRRKEAL